MLAGKREMVGWVPILRGYNQFISWHVFVGYSDDFVAPRHWERTSGKKVVLSVDDQKCGHKRQISKLNPRFVSRSYAFLSKRNSRAARWATSVSISLVSLMIPMPRTFL